MRQLYCKAKKKGIGEFRQFVRSAATATRSGWGSLLLLSRRRACYDIFVISRSHQAGYYRPWIPLLERRETTAQRRGRVPFESGFYGDSMALSEIELTRGCGGSRNLGTT